MLLSFHFSERQSLEKAVSKGLNTLLSWMYCDLEAAPLESGMSVFLFCHNGNKGLWVSRLK